jgi:acyl-coenzyme A synthetase/AMP-(fatty) acid ligase
VDLVAAVYGVWRAGGVTVIADRGLGLQGLGRAVRSTRPSWVIGPKRALAASTALRWSPRATRLDVADLLVAAAGELPAEPSGDDMAAVLFTSGATGPAKGVRYLHRQLVAQRDALAATYSITADDRLVAAFAPFALYGPALGIPTALPNCDVTKPAELTAAALDEACTRIGATLAFASPAALANVVVTSDGSALAGMEALRVVFSAGAPVPSETLEAVSRLAPNATLHTPYGMTEVLPVADVELGGIIAAEAADPDGGVCVGHPVSGAQVRIVPLDFDATELPDAVTVGVMGEILVRAPWVSEGYSGLWATQRAARPGSGEWHRSGDVGHVDTDGRLWVEGRAVHVVHGVDGPITPVPVERAVERALGVPRCAAVGVGPVGSQQLVVVLEEPGAVAGAAGAEVADRVRAVVERPVAAVLTAPSLPVDIRHNAKIDRAAVAEWAEGVLAGRRVRKLA